MYSRAFLLPWLILAMFPGGCFPDYGCRPTAPQQFPATGKSRAEVVAAIGEPAQSHSTVYGTLDVYKLEAASCESMVFPVPYILVLPLFWTEYEYYTVAYSLDDRVFSVGLWPSADNVDEVLASAIQRHQEEAARRAELTTRAESGDNEAAYDLAIYFGDDGPLRALAEDGSGDAAYRLAKLLEDSDPAKLAWYCDAAALQHAEAIAEVSSYYDKGRAGVEHDPIRAYVWMRIAEQEGHASRESASRYYRSEEGWSCCLPAGLESETLAARLDPAQLLQAEVMVTKWQPSDCPRF